MYFQRHIFFCTNKRPDGTGCGYIVPESESFALAKPYMKEIGILGEGKCRASKSGCLGRCEDGPVCVIYPDGIWYSYVDQNDIKEIIDKHLVHGKIVSRLQI